jgi:hypothetical protein
MALSLSDIYSPQAKAISATRKPYKIPLASVIHAELPAKIEAGRNVAETALTQKALDQQQQSIEAQSSLDTRSLALKREQMDAEKKAADTSSKIALRGLALQGGLGLAKLYGSGDLGKAAGSVGEGASNLFASIFGAGTGSGLDSFFGSGFAGSFV